jgi:hypothetical protein
MRIATRMVEPTRPGCRVVHILLSHHHQTLLTEGFRILTSHIRLSCNACPTSLRRQDQKLHDPIPHSLQHPHGCHLLLRSPTILTFPVLRSHVQRLLRRQVLRLVHAIELSAFPQRSRRHLFQRHPRRTECLQLLHGGWREAQRCPRGLQNVETRCSHEDPLLLPGQRNGTSGGDQALLCQRKD